MLGRFRDQLTYANVISTLCLVLILGGGVAYAANTVFSGDIVDGQVKTADIGNNQVRGADVRNDTLSGGGLTGADIADRSGVDTCVNSTRLGDLCVRAENFARPWDDAIAHCGNLDMRVPSYAEAHQLARAHDIPNVAEDEDFWTGQYYISPAGERRAPWTDDTGIIGDAPAENELETVCVTNPTN